MIEGWKFLFCDLFWITHISRNHKSFHILFALRKNKYINMAVSDYLFQIDDTNEGCYRDITSSLLSKGWNRISQRNKPKLRKKNFSSKDAPLLVWTISEKDSCYDSLYSQQIWNHFEGILQLTTKMGFCDLLRESKWLCQNSLDLSPRYDSIVRSWPLSRPLYDA